MRALKTLLWLAVFMFAGLAQARAETATLVSNIDLGTPSTRPPYADWPGRSPQDVDD